MKTLLAAVMILTISFAANAQESLPGKNKTAPETPQRAHVDYFLEIKGVDGESSEPDTLPPPPGHLSISAGATLSQISNSNLLERYSVQSKPGYMFSIGYARELGRSRIQFNASYSKGGVTVASGDIDGDGQDNNTNVDLDYISIPVQYQFYFGRSRRFFAGVGGYASFLVSSNKRGLPVYEEDFKKYDAGCMASAGMWMGSRLMVQTGYNYGLVDIDISKANKSRNGMAFLVLSYSLYSKTQYGPVLKVKPQG